MKYERLEHARYPKEPSAGFAWRVAEAARHAPAPLPRPSLLPECLDAIGWAAAVWVGGFLAGEFFR